MAVNQYLQNALNVIEIEEQPLSPIVDGMALAQSWT